MGLIAVSYKRVRFRGSSAESLRRRGGTENSKVRRERMGHIRSWPHPRRPNLVLPRHRSRLAELAHGHRKPAREWKATQHSMKFINLPAKLVTWVDEAKRNEDLPTLEAELRRRAPEIERKRDLASTPGSRPRGGAWPSSSRRATRTLRSGPAANVEEKGDRPPSASVSDRA